MHSDDWTTSEHDYGHRYSGGGWDQLPFLSGVVMALGLGLRRWSRSWVNQRRREDCRTEYHSVIDWDAMKRRSER